jgi:hypothetical protein
MPAEYDPSTHPLLRTLTVLNPNLTALELNASPRIGPSLECLLRAGINIWPDLKELALIPVPLFRGAERGYGYGGRTSREDWEAVIENSVHMAERGRGTGDEKVESPFADALLAFLEAHHKLESVRLGTGSKVFVHGRSVFSLAQHGLGPEFTTDGAQFQNDDPNIANLAAGTDDQPTPATQFPPSLLSGLSTSALPLLSTFEGPMMQDFLVILDPAANRPLYRLTEIKGWLTVGSRSNETRDASAQTNSTTATSEREERRASDGSVGTSSSPAMHSSPTTSGSTSRSSELSYFSPPGAVPLPTLAHSLAGNPSLRVIILRLGATPLGRSELALLLSSIPNVQHLVLMAKCACRRVS